MLTTNDIAEAILKYHPKADIDVVLKAYLFSAKAHRSQSRQSGEAYLSHPLAVAYNLTRLRMDEHAVAAGLLHDTLEDTIATPEELQESFGEEVYHLVDGVTKISRMEFASLEEKQAENFRKMILAMSKDIRVILIKLADRMHNMTTLDSMPAEAQKRIARETLEIFAPLANRLGIGWIKAELENGAFKYLYPEENRALEESLEHGEAQRALYVEKVCDLIAQEMAAANIRCQVKGRPKHIYSIFEKMQQQNLTFNDIYDLAGVRVITGDVKDCYTVMGLVHSLWKPIPGKFKDYIAMPKGNMYQSLHTTVVGPEGHRVEVQIRTDDMHRVAEEGIAAHWQYKEEGASSRNTKLKEQLVWVRQMLENNKDLKNPKEFLDSFKVDLYPDEVYVFTPKGKVVSMPKGSTPVDFAYYVHTDIGQHCVGAKVNWRMVPLRYRLRNGDRVEILSSKQKEPSRDWLSFVRTSRARQKIMSYLNGKEKARTLELGKAELEREVRKYDLHPESILHGKPLEAAVNACGFNSLDTVLAAIGQGKLTAHHFAERLIPKEKLEAAKLAKTAARQPPVKKTARKSESGICVRDLAEGNLLLKVGKCCSPVPGDKIVGYVTRGRGVSVHAEDCHSLTALNLEPERLIPVEWETLKHATFPTQITLVSMDKPGMLANISAVFAEYDINITRATITQGAHKRAYFNFSIEIRDLDHLNRTLAEVRKIEGVVHVERAREPLKKTAVKDKEDAASPKPEEAEKLR